ncbi:MAG: 4Fe-4S dicluster domain-containing protein [Desulfuromonadales bacterium]
MLKQLELAELHQLLERLAMDYRLQVPQLLADGTRQLAPYGDGELSLHGPVVQRKPTAYFFPQTERLLTVHADGAVELPLPADKPLALFGLNRSDLAGIAFLDRFFSAVPADDVYSRNRDGSLLLALTGEVGPDQAFLPLSAGDCDLEIIRTNGRWLALGHSGKGKMQLHDFVDGETELLTALRQCSEGLAEPLNILRQASQLLINDQVPEQFWSEIADRCILCSGCNLACPTCSCFCIQDRTYDKVTERSRVWDSCQLDAFMREASGHNPLGTEALRTRRRIHHKLAADVERWGELGCIACGRCDRTCPTGIGIIAVAEELVSRYQTNE